MLAFEEDMLGDVLGRRDAARFGLGPRGFDLPRCLALEIGPLRLADLQLRDMGLELGQRIARPFGRDFVLGLVGLGVLEAVPFEPRYGQPQQRRLLLLADMADGLVDQPRRLSWLGAVAIEDRQPVETREIGRDILARCLIFRWNRIP